MPSCARPAHHRGATRPARPPRSLARPARLALVAALIGLASLPSAWATATVTRSPVPGFAAPNYLEFAYAEAGLAELNPGGAVEDFAPGYHVTTRGAADNGTGQIRGSAGYVLDANTAGSLPGAQFDNFLDGAGVLTGGTPGSTVTLTVLLDAHGSFASRVGQPQGILLAYLYVGDANQFIQYGSQLEFNWVPATGAVQTSGRGFQGSSPTGPAYADAQPLVFSSSASNLSGQARISFQATVGAPLYVQGVLGGAAGPLVKSGVSQASAGLVEAWGTAQLQLLLPSGYALSQATGALASPQVTSPVPEPHNAALLLAGIAALGALGTWRARAGGRSGPSA